MLIAMIIASITDMKKKEIPIFLFPLFTTIFITINHAVIHPIDSLLGFVIGAISFSILAWKFSGGGGDIIMMSCIGAAYGTKILSHIIIISSILILVYYIIMKIQKETKRTVPYAPFVTISFIFLLLGGIFYGINDYRFLENGYFLL